MILAEIFDIYLIDLDGVVYLGDDPIPGSAETINKLLELGKAVAYITNDPRKNQMGYCEKLKSMGIPTNPEYVITSVMAMTSHLKNNYDLNGKTAYVIGADDLKDEIKNIGVQPVLGERGKSADFVIVGGHKDFNYLEMKTASLAVRAGAHFYATNKDSVFPTPEGLVPATGAIVASIEVASGKEAKAVGKPGRIMFDAALAALNGAGKTVVIGDRLDVDILGGKNANLYTMLSLTGSTTLEDIKASSVKPDYVINDLTDIFKDADWPTS